jgi:RHS repeat-associated protein
MVIDASGAVNNHYTYDPWGYSPSGEAQETVSSLYRFAGYAYDTESLTYYCINRIYDPVLGRFTSRDPVEGTYQEPMTLHRYLYCVNNPINMADPTGKRYENAFDVFIGIAAYYSALDIALRQGGDADILDALVAVNSFREMMGNTPGLWDEVRTLAFIDPGIIGLMNDELIYGNYCGAGGGGVINDELDQACATHDDCYANAGGPGGFPGVVADSAARRECDRQFCMGTIKANCHAPEVHDPMECEAAKTSIATLFCVNGTRDD